MNLETPLQATRATRVRYQVLAWACALSMITYIDRVCIKDVGGDMRQELGISDQQFAWVFSAFGLAYALFEVPSGWLGDKFGPRLVLGRIVLWWSLFTAMTGLVWKFSYDLGYTIHLGFWEVNLIFDSLVLLVIIRFLFGAGEAGAYPNIARALRNWFPYSQRGKAQGLLWMFGRWGGAIASPLIAALALMVGWRGAFIVFGVVGAVWVLLFLYYFRDHPDHHSGVNEAEKEIIRGSVPESQKPPPISWKAILSSPTLWCLSLMYFCSNAGWCFFITWDKKFYETVLHLEGLPLVIAASGPLFFGGIACYLGGFLTDRQVRVWGRRWGRTLQGFIAYGLGAGLFLAALAMARQPVISMALLCLASFMKDFAMAASWSTCIDIGHRYSGTVAGFMNMVGNLGTFVSPPIVAALAGGFKTTPGIGTSVGAGVPDTTNWGLALVYSAGMFTLASIGWLFINPRKVIVYSPEDHRKLQETGVLQG